MSLFIDELRRTVADTSTEPADRARCAKDWSWPALYAEQQGAPKLPDAVVRPASDNEVAAVLRLATEHA